MSKAEERTNEVVGPYNDGDWTDHSGHNAYWAAFREGYSTAENDILGGIRGILNWPPGENEVAKIIRIENLVKEYGF